MKIHADYEIIMTLFIVGTESMGMNKSRTSSAKQNLLLSLGINAVLLGVFLCLFTPHYQSNDDFILSCFVNGAIAEKSARMVYINVMIGALLKGLYTLTTAVPWYALMQYVILFASFTAMTWILLQRWELIPALALSIGFVSIFGMDAYIIVQYTKTTAAATVSGVMLMLYALGMEKGVKSRRVSMAAGIILALLGGMYRYYEFLAAGAVICWAIIDPLTEAIKHGDDIKEKLHRAFETVRPFILLLLLFGTVRAIDSAAYSEPKWADYIEYNKARTLVMDHGTPRYDMFEEGYADLGISENFYQRMRFWNFHDPDKFDTETFYKIAALKGERKLIGGDTAIIDFFPICVPQLIREWCFAGLVLAAAVWLLFGRHDLMSVISIVLSAVTCLCVYIYFFFSDRFGIYWVDYGITLALTAVVLWNISGGRPRKWQARTAVILMLTLALQCVYMTKWKDSFTRIRDNEENIAAQSKAIQTLVDDGHLMLSDVSMLNTAFYMYQPVFRQAIPESADKIVTMGGWHITPTIVSNLSHYGIRNPYKDAVNNPDVYMITGEIDLLLSCMREYTPNAEAALIEPLSSQTGLLIYSITAD